MTRAEIRNRLGSNINQTSDTGEFVSGFITTSEANTWIQWAFEDIYRWYGLANKSVFSEQADGDLQANRSIYALGGDASDCLAVSEVYLKTSPTDTTFTRAYPLDTADYFRYGSEKVPQGSPRYSEIMIKQEGTDNYVKAIEFYADAVPQFDLQDGFYIRYIARPPKLESDSDIPQRIPEELHKLIVKGATYHALLKMGERSLADECVSNLQNEIRAFFTQEQFITTKGMKTLHIPRLDVKRFYQRR